MPGPSFRLLGVLRMERRVSTFCCLVAAFALVLGLSGCKSESDRVKEAVRPTLESYEPRDDDNKKEEVPDPDYGDSETASVLETYDIDVDKLHELCFARYSYEVGDVTVSDDGNSATAHVTITNVSLAAAANNAASDYESYAGSDEAQAAYSKNGHKALLQHLFELLFNHLQADDVVSTEVDLSLYKNENGDWTFDSSGNADLYNALYGGSNVLGGLASVAE